MDEEKPSEFWPGILSYPNIGGQIMGIKRRMKWGIILVIVGLITIQTEAHGNSWNWEFLSSDRECDFYFDPGMTSRSPENIVRVWWKEDFKTKEILKSRGFTGSEYKNAAYQINVTEINCPKKESRRKFFMLCSEKGENILCNIHRQKSDEWVPVWQVIPIGALYWKLCQ